MRQFLFFSVGTGKTGRMDTGESLLDLKSISIPGVSDWLSKYLIKVRDKNTILLYPKDGSLLTQNNVTQDPNPIPEVADLINNNVSDNSVNTEQEDIPDINKGKNIADKRLRVLKLKKLLEQRLKISLDKKSESEFIPSQEEIK